MTRDELLELIAVGIPLAVILAVLFVLAGVL